VNSIIALNKQLQTEENNFFNTLQEDKGIANISRNIEHFYQMEYDVFKKELLKQKVKISLGNENNEWRSYFETSKQAVAEIQTKIQQTEAEIDTMVFALYGLTPSEIEIVENDTK
jgi:hypothetical protein